MIGDRLAKRVAFQALYPRLQTDAHRLPRHSVAQRPNFQTHRIAP
jgi:hypothetical protein